MTRYAAFAGAVFVLFAIDLLVVEALGVPLLVDPEARTPTFKEAWMNNVVRNYS